MTAPNLPWAHSPNSIGQPHDLVGHLRAVASTAARFAAPFGANALAHSAGLWHDIGKFHPGFQAYLRLPTGGHGPPHSPAGAFFAWDVGFSTLTLLIAGHHAGLPAHAKLKSLMGEYGERPAVREAIRLAQRAIEDLPPIEGLARQVPAFLTHGTEDERRRTAEFFIRMLFSTLVDADFLDTEAHFHPERTADRDGGLSLAELWTCLEAAQAAISGRDDTPLQRIRHEVYEHCLTAAESPPGLFRLTVPTGGGKTRSGLAFALRHALRHGLSRVIVAIPYTSIIEQTADVYREIFGQPDAVLEHHSAVAERDEDNSPVTAVQQWARLASENWDATLIVTTTVQLFESLFARRPGRCRKLHRLAGSVIVLDEVQTLPPHLLDPTLDAIRELTRHYGTTVVFCTATQPAFGANRYLRGLPEVREIVPDPARHFFSLRRVEFERPAGNWSWERVADEMRANPQSLAVLNTKADACAVLDALGDDPTVLHLSTQLCGAHRSEVLETVRQRLRDGQPCRLVSTQVIEAGVDVDFPSVLRAVGPLDRIVQAAGRCNREGRLPGLGRVIVFEPEEGGSPPGAYRAGQDLAAGMLAKGCDLHDPATYEMYFERLFGAVVPDREKIQSVRKDWDFPEVARRYRLIDDDSAAVVVRPNWLVTRVDPLLDAVRGQQTPPREAMRRLQRFTVNVRSRQVPFFESQALLRPLVEGLWEWCGGYDRLRGLVATGINPDELFS